MKPFYIITLCLVLATSCSLSSQPRATQTATSAIAAATREIVPTPTVIPSPTATPTHTPTATPIPTFTLSGVVFFDYNGNGIHDEVEPSVESLEVVIKKGDSDWMIQTDMDGVFSLEAVPRGNYKLEISNASEYGFRYITPSAWEAIPIEQGLQVTVDGYTRIGVPLVKGPHVLPFPQGVEYEIWTWFDRDLEDGKVLNWLGESDVVYSEPYNYYSLPIRVQDGHYAIDYAFVDNVPIVATNAGEINRIERDERQLSPDDHIIYITTITGLTLDYGHVKPVDGLYVGKPVHRGELIAYAVNTIYSQPYFQEFSTMTHVGFVPPGSRSYSDSIDPYPDLWTTADFDMARVTLELDE